MSTSKPSEWIEIYHYWYKGDWVACYFNNNKEIGRLWNNMCQKLMLLNRFPTKSDYDDFIEKNTPEYFPPTPLQNIKQNDTNTN